jgi:tetratricopeptide (TPR) repeat protein
MQLKVNYDVPRCRAMLARAIELDPHFAEARAWYGFTNWLMLDAGYTNEGWLLYEAEREMRGALRDDPDLARAHAFLAPIYLTQGRKELMPATLDRALNVNPFDEDARQWLMHYHHYNGDYRTAQGIAEQVLSRLPLFFPTRMILGDMLRQQGDLAGAVRELEKILEQDAQNSYAIRFLARAHIDAGDLAAAHRLLDSARPQDGRSYWTRLLRAILLSLEGDIPAALVEVNEDVLKWGGVAGHLTSEVATFYSVAGDVSAALLWLDRAVRHGDERGEYFARDPLLANVRADPRFAHILASIRHRSSLRQAVT